MFIYRRRAHYHETDQMGIVHHSNYVRWFEEARVHLLQQAQLGYHELERMGIRSVILGYSCDNHKPACFGDTFVIHVRSADFTGVRITFLYQVFRQSDGELLATGETRHCFVSTQMMPINLKRKYPAVCATLVHMLPEERDA